MSTIDSRLEVDSLTTLHWIGINLTLITAVVHLIIGLSFFPSAGGILFLLAAGGFVGALGLLFVDYRRRLLYAVGVPYTAIQIVAWYVIQQPAGPADIGLPAVIDKLAQLALIGVLITLYSWDW